MALQANKNLLRVILFLYLLSGLSSLAYEILWARMLSLEFGVSIFGVVVTVAVFMLGLGMGSLAGARILKIVARPLHVFAILEVSIAIFSLIIPLLNHWIGEWQFGLVRQSPLVIWYAWQFIITGMVLLVPALLMGIGFPMILSVFKESPSALGTIYSINTIGAAIGALLPLLLLPAFGWNISLYLVAAISVFVGFTAELLCVKFPALHANAKPASLPPLTSSQIKYLLGYAGIGAAALMLEIGWTRLFGMLFLRTEYVLAIILAVFLVGIALGSYVARFLNRDTWFRVLPVITGTFVLISLWILPKAVNLIDSGDLTSLVMAMVYQGFVIMLLTLPVTLVFGAWLPLLNYRLGYSGIGGARLYGANSVGAALGALVAGFLLTPTVGTYATIVLAALMTILFSMTWITNKSYGLVIVVLAAVAYPVYDMVPVNELMPRIYANTKDLYRYEDAVNITHVVERNDGQRLLLADLQRMDASSDPVSVESQKNQVRLPLLLHPNPQSILFLGMGTGISASSSLAYTDIQRTAVELSRGAITAASKWFKPVNSNIVDQTIIIRDDARRFLKTDTEQYDVIVGDLFHPDLVGRSALLSLQQFQRVKQRLSEQGVFVQWVALNQFEIPSLEIILRTFKRVFPDSVLFVDAFRVALVGTNGFVPTLKTVQNNVAKLSEANCDIITGGEGAFTWLGRYWGKIMVNKNGPVQDEWSPKIEYRLPQARYSGELDLAKLLDYMLRQRPHVSQAGEELQVPEKDVAAFERAYIATELAHRSWLALLRQNNTEGQRLLRSAFQANPKDRWIGFAVADATLENFDLQSSNDVSEKQLLESILKIRPDHAEALRRLWRIAVREHDIVNAQIYKGKLTALSPLDISLSAYDKVTH